MWHPDILPGRVVGIWATIALTSLLYLSDFFRVGFWCSKVKNRGPEYYFHPSRITLINYFDLCFGTLPATWRSSLLSPALERLVLPRPQEILPRPQEILHRPRENLHSLPWVWNFQECVSRVNKVTAKSIYTPPPVRCHVECPPGFIPKFPCGCTPLCPSKEKKDAAGRPICRLGCPPEWSLEPDCSCVPPLEKRVPLTKFCALACIDGLVFQPPCSCVAVPVCPVADWLVSSALSVIFVGSCCAEDQGHSFSRDVRRNLGIWESGGKGQGIEKNPTFLCREGTGIEYFSKKKSITRLHRNGIYRKKLFCNRS